MSLSFTWDSVMGFISGPVQIISNQGDISIFRTDILMHVCIRHKNLTSGVTYNCSLPRDSANVQFIFIICDCHHL